MWLPEHWLMPIRFAGSGHVLSSKSAADHRMIVMLYTPTAQLDVIETCSISCLEHKHWRTLLLKCMMQSDPVQFLWKMNQPFFRIFLTCLLNTISVVLKDLLFCSVFILFVFAWEALCLTYHPDVGASLKLSINTVPSEVRVHLQPGRFGKFHTSLQTYCCHNVVCLNLKQQHNKNNHYI